MSNRRRIPTTYGEGAIIATPALVKELGAERVLVVCGTRSFEASGAARMLPALQQVADVTRWSDFSPNTSSTDLERGLAVIQADDPDLVLGVGGGSAMDIAKLLCAYDSVPVDEVRDAIRSGATITARRRALVLAPTTSGSGSQATHFAVVYIGDDKYSIAGPAMYPDRIVLDPQLAASGSPHQRATSGIDAICQAIESLWAVAATESSRRRARYALHYLLPSIERFVHVADPSSTRAMSIGSHLAGQAIDTSKTTAAHALSYGITKKYGVDHGNAVALTLGAFIDAHDGVRRNELQPSIDPEMHRRVMDQIRAALGVERPGQAQARFASLLQSLGLASSLADIGVDNEPAIRALVASVNTERLGNNPVRHTDASLMRVLHRAAWPYVT